MVSLRPARLHSEFQVNLGWAVRTCLRKTLTQEQTRRQQNKTKQTKNKQPANQRTTKTKVKKKRETRKQNPDRTHHEKDIRKGFLSYSPTLKDPESHSKGVHLP